MYEETGIEAGDLQYINHWTFTIPQINKSVLNLGFCTYCESDVVLSSEHQDFKWCTIDEVLKFAKHQDHTQLVHIILTK